MEQRILYKDERAIDNHFRFKVATDVKPYKQKSKIHSETTFYLMSRVEQAQT